MSATLGYAALTRPTRLSYLKQLGPQMKSAALIGINHADQYPGHKDGRSDLFCKFVTKQAISLAVDFIAEEMSREALLKEKVYLSSVEIAAWSIGVRHRLCDPDSAERKALGIPSFDELREARGFSRYISEREEKQLEADERLYWPIREKEWLDRIQGANHSSLLFILGAQHVESFARLLEQAQYHVNVISPRWRGSSRRSG